MSGTEPSYNDTSPQFLPCLELRFGLLRSRYSQTGSVLRLMT